MRVQNSGGETAVMGHDQQTTIEQLWYTWSEIGIDLIEVGFRIRAASPGLHDVRNEHVQFLDQYERYSLPRGTEGKGTSPEVAPVCLALLRPQERSEAILLQKVYTGNDGFGRPGAFFVHLLSDLPPDFSARDAIQLWQAPFWQRSDRLLRQKDPRSTLLDSLTLADLRAGSQRIDNSYAPDSVLRLVPDSLSFLLQAYLEKHPVVPQRQEKSSRLFRRTSPSQEEQFLPPIKIVIVAADQDVAFLLFALTSCLPSFLNRRLTFSTYERNIMETPAEIVGMCWLGHSTLEAEQDPFARELISSSAYHEQLVLNRYTKEISPLDQHPRLFPRPLAKRYAQDAQKYFLLHYHQYYPTFSALSEEEQYDFIEKHPDFALLRSFADLFEAADQEPDLDIDTFLQLYESIVLNPESVSDAMLNTLFAAKPGQQISKKLGRSSYQVALIARSLRDVSWWQHVRPIVLHWRQSAAPSSPLERAFSQTLQQAMRSFVSNIKTSLTQGEPLSSMAQAHELQRFNTLLDLLTCFMLSPSSWLNLLKDLAALPGAARVLTRNMAVYHSLVQNWIIQLSPEKEKDIVLIQSLLPSPLSDFSTFLALNLPSLWQGALIKRSLATHPSPAPFVRMLETSHHEDLRILFQHLVASPQGWRLASEIFLFFVDAAYRRKLTLLFILLDGLSPLQYSNSIRQVVQSAHLGPGERAPFLSRFGRFYLPVNPLTRMMLSLLEDLAQDDLHLEPPAREKMHVLRDWLDNAELGLFFTDPKKGPDRLSGLLHSAQLTPTEAEQFLMFYGPRFCSQRTISPFLKRLLLEQAEAWKRKLPATSIDLWQADDASPSLSQLEYFFWFLSQPPHLAEKDQQFFYAWYILTLLMRQPRIIYEHTSLVIYNLSRVLTQQEILSKTRDQILQKIARAILPNEAAVPSLLTELLAAFPPNEAMLLLYTVAGFAGTGISERRYQKTLCEICIQYILTLKENFTDDETYQRFLYLFLDALLEHSNKQLRAWLKRRVRRWPPESQAVWQAYQQARSRPSRNAPRPFLPGLIFWRKRKDSNGPSPEVPSDPHSTLIQRKQSDNRVSQLPPDRRHAFLELAPSFRH